MGGFGSGRAFAGGGNGGPPAGFTPPSGAGDRGGQVSSSMIGYLLAHQGSAKYLVAATGSQSTAPIIIQTGKAVITIGGFSGNDNAPTLVQFKEMVAKGEVKYVLIGGGGFGRGGSSDIASWVTAHGKAVSGQSGLYLVTA